MLLVILFIWDTMTIQLQESKVTFKQGFASLLNIGTILNNTIKGESKK
jgi:hypothetical protein